MSNITELSPNNTGSKSTTNKKMSQLNNNKEPSKSSYVTTIHRKDSISNISKQQYAKYEACPVASEKKQQNNAKKIKLVLPTNPVKNADSNHYSASVGIPVRSFLTNNSNKLTHLKNQVKGGIYENKGDNAMELQKMQ